MSKKTPLYDSHLSQNAFMAEFAGYLLPLRFESELQEHHSVRTTAGIFDVSHMGEFLVSGKNAQVFLQKMLSNNLEKCVQNQSQYTLLLNNQGGIIDDLIVYHLSFDTYLLCVNASNIEKDFKWLFEHAQGYENLKLENISEKYSQIALQGPNTFLILKALGFNKTLDKFSFCEWTFDNAKALIANTGYTGEKYGVEIFIENHGAKNLWQALLTLGQACGIKPCGLSARDSLRVQAGLLLWGVDMNETITPLEAGLMFAVDMKKNDFLGKKALFLQKEHQQKKLVGFRLCEKGIARHGYEVFDAQGQNIGEVTSGTLPFKEEFAIGFAMINKAVKKNDDIFIQIRNKKFKAKVCLRNFLKG